MTADWRLDCRPSPELPPLAWIARIRHPTVEIRCGTSVRRVERAIFEGTWAGEADIESILSSTTVFGSGIVADQRGLHVVPPAHNMDGVYVGRGNGDLFVANSLVAVLAAIGIDLVGGVDYPTRMRSVSDGLDASPIEIPTTGRPVDFHFFENLRIAVDGTVVVERKPREAPFATFEDYVARMSTALGSSLANGSRYEPVMAVSSGYDSTAMAVLAARNGCRRAVTFAHGRPAPGARDLDDSGAATAARLGMEVETFDRLSYLRRDDLPEAEFLATGMSGEDVAMLALEPAIRGRAVINGMAGGALWRKGRVARDDLWRSDLSGCSLAEYRLRADFVWLPLPVFAMTEQPSVQVIGESPGMKPWAVPGHYDQPVARRIAEEGGIPRGTFATVKRGATSTMQLGGAALMAPRSLAAAGAWAAARGETLDLAPRPRLRRRDRFLIHAAKRLRMPWLSRGIEARRRTLMHFEPQSGSLLLRWAVDVIRARYSSVAAGGPPQAGG